MHLANFFTLTIEYFISAVALCTFLNCEYTARYSSLLSSLHAAIQSFKESLLLTLATKLPELRSNPAAMEKMQNGLWGSREEGRETKKTSILTDKERGERERRDAVERPQAEEGADARS